MNLRGNWKTVGKFAVACVPFVLILVILLSVACFPRESKEEETAKRVVRVWNVDTFEGGTGSRTSFLRKIARKAEGERNVYYLVTSYTAEGAEDAFSKGECPDMISFGIGLSCFAERSLPLPYSFPGGELGGETLAIPWCRGEYYLFSPREDFGEEGRIAISEGGSNLACISALLAGIGGEPVESTAAYVGFLGGKYRYLLGTQRDVYRFRTRNVQVYRKTLTAYNDLYQYISVLSSEKREDCLALLAMLRSAEVQEMLSEIGMLPVGEDGSERTVSVFSDASALERLRLFTAEGGGAKNLDKFLKNI